MSLMSVKLKHFDSLTAFFSFRSMLFLSETTFLQCCCRCLSVDASHLPHVPPIYPPPTNINQFPSQITVRCLMLPSQCFPSLSSRFSHDSHYSLFFSFFLFFHRGFATEIMLFWFFFLFAAAFLSLGRHSAAAAAIEKSDLLLSHRDSLLP